MTDAEVEVRIVVRVRYPGGLTPLVVRQAALLSIPTSRIRTENAVTGLAEYPIATQVVSAETELKEVR